MRLYALLVLCAGCLATEQLSTSESPLLDNDRKTGNNGATPNDGYVMLQGLRRYEHGMSYASMLAWVRTQSEVGWAHMVQFQTAADGLAELYSYVVASTIAFEARAEPDSLYGQRQPIRSTVFRVVYAGEQFPDLDPGAWSMQQLDFCWDSQDLPPTPDHARGVRVWDHHFDRGLMGVPAVYMYPAHTTLYSVVRVTYEGDSPYPQLAAGDIVPQRPPGCMLIAVEHCVDCHLEGGTTSNSGSPSLPTLP